MKKLILGLFTFIIVANIGTFGQDSGIVLAPYMCNMQRNIKLNWLSQRQEVSKDTTKVTPDLISAQDSPQGEVSNRTTVFYTIKKDGELQNVSIIKSSGNEDFDNSAINTIKNTKFQPLPIEYDKETIDVEFTFDYNEHK